MPYDANIIYSVIIVFSKKKCPFGSGGCAVAFMQNIGKIMNTNQGLPNSNALLSMVCYSLPCLRRARYMLARVSFSVPVVRPAKNSSAISDARQYLHRAQSASNGDFLTALQNIVPSVSKCEWRQR